MAKRRWPGLAGLAVALLFGVLLRTLWTDDMEYKGDERYAFEKSQAVMHGAPLPMSGIATSKGPPNPGMSVWFTAGISWIAGVQTPPDLARTLQLMNCAAILLLLVFALMCVPAEQRESWLWAVALVSVNPLAVLFQRKIWAPAPIPIFCLAMMAGWWFRGRAWGAFLWGAAGSLIGQLHIPSGLLSLGLALWAWLFDRRSVRWPWWLAGSLLVSLAALPWAWTVLHWSVNHRAEIGWYRLGNLNYWLRGFHALWLQEAFGFDVATFSLGNNAQDFMLWPRLWGWPTRGVLVLELCLGLVALVSLFGLARWVWRERPALGPLVLGRRSQTDFTLSAAFFGYGLLLIAAGVSPIYRHYMIVLFFLEHLWVARLLLLVFAEQLRWARGLLLALCLCEALISAAFLTYVHERQVLGGDYGTTWRAQQASPP